MLFDRNRNEVVYFSIVSVFFSILIFIFSIVFYINDYYDHQSETLIKKELNLECIKNIN